MQVLPDPETPEPSQREPDLREPEPRVPERTDSERPGRLRGDSARRPAVLPAARAGLSISRTPWLTAVVVVVTATPSSLQFGVPGLLATLERTPAGLGGEWWRSATALLVQDGGVAGTVSNLVFLAVIGMIAEQVMSRPRWLVLYLVPGLVGEFAAYAWQPVGAGNSVAICGLAGGLAVLMLRSDVRLPVATPYAQLLWIGALVATVSPVAAVLILVATAPVLGVLRAPPAPRHPDFRRRRSGLRYRACCRAEHSRSGACCGHADRHSYRRGRRRKAEDGTREAEGGRPPDPVALTRPIRRASLVRYFRAP